MCAGLFPQQFPWVARLPAPLLSFRPSGPGSRLGQLVCPTYACLDESRAHASCILGPARGRRIRRLFPRQVHFLPPGASARLAGKLPRRPTSLFPSDYNIIKGGTSMRSTKVILAILLSIAMLFACTGCGEKEVTEYVIGFVGPLTGASAQDGQDALEGAQLYVEQVNAAGGIDGIPLTLNVQDDKGDPKEAAIVANMLAQDESVLAIVGHYNSSCTLAGAPIYNEAGVAAIAYGSSSPAVTEAGPYIYRTIPSDDVGGRMVAQWAFADLSPTKAAIVYENNDYGLGTATIYKEECEAAGVEVVAYENYIPDETTDFTTMLTKIKESGAEVMLLATLYNETAMFAKQAQLLGLSLPMYGVDALYQPALIELGGDAVEGLTISAFFSMDNPDPAVQEFVEAFRAKYDSDPATYHAYAYDATMCIVEALKASGPDREKINEYLTTLTGVNGASGVNSFDENGDVLKDAIRIVIQDGKFNVVQ